MAIIGPADLPKVLRVASADLKAYVMAKMGHPNVLVELRDEQFEIVLRTVGDWIAGYFPLEERFATFRTSPLKSTYPLPADAYWVQKVSWDPATTRIDDVFGAESFLFNIGNISGIQNILTDFNLLQQYRKFSQKILGTEGGWEVKGDNQIRLYPTPRGSFGVVVEYIPRVVDFRSPQAREVAMRMVLAESKIMVGAARRKLGNIPTPDGGTLNIDGVALVEEGNAEKAQALTDAILLGEPIGPWAY